MAQIALCVYIIYPYLCDWIALDPSHPHLRYLNGHHSFGVIIHSRLSYSITNTPIEKLLTEIDDFNSR